MKTVIKNGLERGMVWSFRRFKEPIRSKQEEKSKTESEQESLDTPYQENDLETLPQKNFLELGGISKYQMTKKKLGSSNDVEQLTSVSEEKVVDTINQFRKRLEVNEEKTVTGSQLKKDNATTDEVIKSSPKVKMLEAIFTSAGEEMEWEKIEEKILREVRDL
ncbi:unnamed protein product [Rhizophagus irregularis]|nr:unnamed protein product [Rhizophagus irregularis]